MEMEKFLGAIYSVLYVSCRLKKNPKARHSSAAAGFAFHPLD